MCAMSRQKMTRDTIPEGFTLDSSDARANWVEQLTNAAAQLCFFVGLLLMM